VTPLAVQQPSSGNLPLFLHVLGAVTLFGGVLALVVLPLLARRRHVAHAPLLAGVAWWTFLLIVVPSYIVTRAAAQWILDKEYPHGHEPGWVGVGFLVTDIGILVLVAIGVLAFLSRRRGGAGRTTAALSILAGIYLAALVAAWFAMSAKPGA
jgi:hypothetical protein